MSWPAAEATPEQAPEPVRSGWRRPRTLALLAAGAGVLGVLWYAGLRGPAAPAPPPEDPLRTPLAVLTEQIKQVQSALRELAQQAVARGDEHQQALVALRDEIAATPGRIEALAAAQTQTATLARTTQERLAALEQTLQPWGGQLQALRAEVRQAVAPPVAVATTASPEPREVPASALPFRVVSLDQWGDAPQLGVLRAGRMRYLGVGETVDGWTVAALEPTTRRVVLRAAGQRIHTTVLGR